MNWLFIHQNFPGQFVHAARHLAAAGDTVYFITQQRARALEGVRKIVYAPRRAGSKVHPFVREYELAIENGLAVHAVCEALKRQGFQPDLVVGHNGWGEILYVKDAWPQTPLLGYFEYFYRARDSDLDFDPEFPPQPGDGMRVRTRNSINFLGLDTADWGQTPTPWQRSLYPEIYRRKISVIHEGIETQLVRPDPHARLWLSGGLSLSAQDQVITYSARNLEPYRGFHVFMRALPELLSRLPQARVLIVGENGVSYGRRPAGAESWREFMLRELGDRIDTSRVHFLGRLPYPQYLAVLQLSAAHVYLTYPFVLSWSLLEAMAAGALVIASRTTPVLEVIKDEVNGLVFDFFDQRMMIDKIVAALSTPERHQPLREAARKTVVERYDLMKVCLPHYVKLLRRLAGGGSQND